MKMMIHHETFLYISQDCDGFCRRPFDFLMKFCGIIINYNEFVCDTQVTFKMDEYGMAVSIFFQIFFAWSTILSSDFWNFEFWNSKTGKLLGKTHTHTHKTMCKVNTYLCMGGKTTIKNHSTRKEQKKIANHRIAELFTRQYIIFNL